MIGFFVGLYLMYLVIAAGFSGLTQIATGFLGLFLIGAFIKQVINEK